MVGSGGPGAVTTVPGGVPDGPPAAGEALAAGGLPVQGGAPDAVRAQGAALDARPARDVASARDEARVRAAWGPGEARLGAAWGAVPDLLAASRAGWSGAAAATAADVKVSRGESAWPGAWARWVAPAPAWCPGPAWGGVPVESPERLHRAAGLAGR